MSTKKEVKVIGKVDIPEEFKATMKFVRSNGEVCVMLRVPLTEAELAEKEKAKAEKLEAKKRESEAKKAARTAETKKRWASQIEINNKANAEIKKLTAEVSSLRNDIGKKAKKGDDVSSLQEKLHLKEDRIVELRATKKQIPKQYK